MNDCLQRQILWCLNVDEDVIKNGEIPDKLWDMWEKSKIEFDKVKIKSDEIFLILQYGKPPDNW
ncbi:MAG: hypothetical protein HOK80_09220 [Candidatus Cloacimonetes bacterium]|nr:hypothetical protein [Candidatus Cloacimonadota bacterium]